jgi:hypothetical protein
MQRQLKEEIYAALTVESNIMLGKVISLGTDELVFQSISDETLHPDSVNTIDVFASGKIFYRNLPVKIISDIPLKDQLSFSRMTTREIKVRFVPAGRDELVRKEM